MNNEVQNNNNQAYIDKLCMFDDVFMKACFDSNIEGIELVLRIILDKPDLIVKDIRTQELAKNLEGRDIWFDITADDSDGKHYNIEVQRDKQGANPKRARYHSSIMDAKLLKPNDKFTNLPETYVVFISEKDVLAENKPIYHIDRIILETNDYFGDDAHIVYVNGENRDPNTKLGRLMHDFSSADPDNMFYGELAEKARYLKKREKGAEAMSGVLDELREDVARETAWKTKVESVLRFIKQGLSYEQIAKGLNLSVDQVREIANNKSA